MTADLAADRSPAAGRVVAVGSLNADISVRSSRLPGPGETVLGTTFHVRPGGKSSNQAVAAALLGATVELVGVVGADAHGQLLLGEARRAGVDVTAVTTLDNATTGTAVVMVDDAAENSIIVLPGANAALTPERVPSACLARASVVCLALEIPLDTVLHTALQATRHGAEVVLNLSPTQSVPPQLLQAISVLVVNEHELAALVGDAQTHDWTSVRQALRGVGVERAVVTLGAAGAAVLTCDGVTELEAPRVEAVDTTGSGDAFTGALAAGLAAGLDLAAAARLGNDVGAWVATGYGAQSSYPDAASLRAWAGRTSRSDNTFGALTR